MSIKTGIYEISSALDSQFFIGRCLIEDRSLLPKRVVTLPKDGGKVHPVCHFYTTRRLSLTQ